ncbi:hypothetical protein [Natrinema salifodinae]|uniref:Uncharacterized protein n=1 Tax=Natrinema salifodinae TaxID=1202768 RepID=A0A1I0QZZ3_9EURY|nr:hypothetical protein [Natrinema salifodinae]SEW33047.1 hypothetical protein SAMN05216285_4194 [Natrinema salifodinae]
MNADHQLSRFGVDVGPDDDLDRRDDAEITQQCVAKKADGGRCQNAVSHMTDDPFCSSHSRMDDVEVILDV